MATEQWQELRGTCAARAGGWGVAQLFLPRICIYVPGFASRRTLKARLERVQTSETVVFLLKFYLTCDAQ